jgi:hypothetical protein
LKVEVVRMHRFEDDLDGTRKIIQKIKDAKASETCDKKTEARR